LLCLSQVNDDCRPPDLLKPTQAEVQGQLEATFQQAAWRSRRDVIPQRMARASLFPIGRGRTTGQHVHSKIHEVEAEIRSARQRDDGGRALIRFSNDNRGKY